MQIATNELLANLKETTQNLIDKARELNAQTEENLNWRATAESWSILECLEHLNRYGDFYLPEIEKRIRQGRRSKPVAVFKSGLLGNYFAQSMLPKEKLNKMKTFKNMNPIHSKLDKRVLDTFISQQEKILSLLDMSGAVNLMKTKTAISISTVIKLRLGDTFRFMINHNIRHFRQIEKIEEARA